MEAIRKIIKVKDNMVSFQELEQFNNREVACIILPFQKKPKKANRQSLLKYDGIFSSSFTDTSENTDALIYER